MAAWRAGDWVGTAWIWLSWLFSTFWTSWLDCAVFRASLAAWTLLSKTRNAAVFSSANIWLSWICWRLAASAASIAARAAGFLTAVGVKALIVETPLFCASDRLALVLAWSIALLAASLALDTFWSSSARSSVVKSALLLISLFLRWAASATACLAALRSNPMDTVTWTVFSDAFPWVSTARRVTVYSPCTEESIPATVWPFLTYETISAWRGTLLTGSLKLVWFASSSRSATVTIFLIVSGLTAWSISTDKAGVLTSMVGRSFEALAVT